MFSVPGHEPDSIALRAYHSSSGFPLGMRRLFRTGSGIVALFAVQGKQRALARLTQVLQR